jgi:cobalt-precorrin-5B (C1)-methyltransferase
MVTFAVHSCTFTPDEGRSSVIKDAGDDPDVTHQAEICSRVTWTNEVGVIFQRGVGVGLVTKKGLPVAPGEPAINPAPRKLIAETLQETLIEHGLGDRGLAVEISVPKGEELAKKTFNPRLGIVGGISILGTTGIVVPYSTAAWVATVTQEIDVAVAQGIEQLVLTVGARSERQAAQLFPLPESAFIQMGPFFGDALRHCAKAGVEKIALAAMIGKLAKFAAGHDCVHSTASSQDFAFLATLARAAGASTSLLDAIIGANTGQEVSDLAAAAGLSSFFDAICESAWKHASNMLPAQVKVDVYLLSQDGGILGQWPGGGGKT